MTKTKLNIGQAVQHIAMLAQEFPQCFTIAAPQPLKIRIKEDIIGHWGTEPKLSKSKLQQAIYYYTNSASYLNAFKTEPVRVNLEGTPDAEILTYERTYAQEQYFKRYSKRKTA